MISTLKALCVSASLMLAHGLAHAQSEDVRAIEDNSFFIEEAYNQEDGVIQHISTLLSYSKPTKDVFYSLTEEIPLGSQIHQVGFTLPALWLNAAFVSGIGDILINYRYQLSLNDSWAAIAPRVSLIIPTGKISDGLGNGALGFQVNLPVSKRLSNRFVAHANLGATIIPNTRSILGNGNEVTSTFSAWNVGGSVIALVSSEFNLLLEVNASLVRIIDETGNTLRFTETIVSPGARYAIDVSTLQIVPGIAIPFRFADGVSNAGMFFYLSFEHGL